jgi:hypothetical protein
MAEDFEKLNDRTYIYWAVSEIWHMFMPSLANNRFLTKVKRRRENFLYITPDISEKRISTSK